VAVDVGDSGPAPQPEREEARVRDAGLFDLSARDYAAVLKRAVKEALDDDIPLIAGALAYSAFLAIPASLLLAVGLFTLVAGPGTIDSLIDRLEGVIPADAARLLNDSLQRLDNQPGASIAITIVGFALALWSATGAMNALMTGINIAYDRKDKRSFLRKRGLAVVMVVCVAFAVLLVFGLLVLGPHLSRWIGDAVGAEDATVWVWWVAQWPVLVLGLLLVFAVLLYFGPDVDQPHWRFISPGSLVAATIWLIASGAFAFYSAEFGSFNKTWGSLSAVIVMLIWLWLSGLALLFGAEVNAEVERSRELRAGKPAEHDLQVATSSRD
jgi:membrane protein